MASDSNAERGRPAAGIAVPKFRRGVKGYFREVMREMRQVRWPSWNETVRLSGIVIVICLMVILFLFILAWAFGIAIEMFLRGGA